MGHYCKGKVEVPWQIVINFRDWFERCEICSCPLYADLVIKNCEENYNIEWGGNAAAYIA
jgi:hypothetical protein